VIIALSVVAYMVVKAGAIYGIARLLKSNHGEALERAVLMSQGGEFAFVLYTTAAGTGLIDAPTNAIFTATVIVSMVLTPFAIIGLRYVMPKAKPSMEGVEKADGLDARILLIGFGRFGQIASQPLLAMRHRVSIIDIDTEMIRVAVQLGFKVYYGDGTRLDILRAAGAGTADVVMICVDDRDSAIRIAELLRDEFPLVKVMARAFDRGHAIKLLHTGAEYQIREVFESSLAFGGAAIRILGASEDEVSDIIDGVRQRDRQRFDLQLAGGEAMAGRHLLLSNAEDQARESGVAVDPDAVEEAVAKTTQPVEPA
jgi:glutathione-regulated potassium-efflux system protein KefB